METPTEAAEIIALADLLIRLIERRASAVDAPVREWLAWPSPAPTALSRRGQGARPQVTAARVKPLVRRGMSGLSVCSIGSPLTK